MIMSNEFKHRVPESFFTKEDHLLQTAFLLSCERIFPHMNSNSVIFGDRGGSFTDSTPASAIMPRKSPVYNGSRSWMRYLCLLKTSSTLQMLNLRTKVATFPDRARPYINTCDSQK